MRIAVVNEVSASLRNSDIVAALEEQGHEVLNLGMKTPEELPELTYLHTGLISALALEMKIADFVVGGCGTGQGYLNAVLQYPGVVCGLVLDSLDAWLYTRINAGNCISLALNKGYGWAANMNLKLLFAELFPQEKEEGYPAARAVSQKESRERLKTISTMSHHPMTEILDAAEDWLLKPVFTFPRFVAAVEQAEDSILQRKCMEIIRSFR